LDEGFTLKCFGNIAV